MARPELRPGTFANYQMGLATTSIDRESYIRHLATPLTLPAGLAPCFQEYDLAVLDPQRNADLIIERVLALGNRAELGWLFERYGWTSVRTWCQQRGVRRLSRRLYRLWCVVLNIEEAPDRRMAWPH